MAAFVLGLLLFAMMSGYSDANWCACRPDASESALQKALDYACGAGADCTPIIQNGPCYNPNTVRAHCNWAVNSYFQRKGQVQGSCEFAGAATVTATDPSVPGCTFPQTASPTTPGTNTPGSNTPTTPSTGGTTPGTFAPPGGFNSTTPGIIGNGGMGGGGISPTGFNTDSSDGGYLLQKSFNLLVLVTLWFSGLVFWWG